MLVAFLCDMVFTGGVNDVTLGGDDITIENRKFITFISNANLK
jgi:hypothetical protein